ncbi:MAG: AAA family ATPase [Rhodobacterales bacterium]|nr:AAA family ATPase [Rhodobacterales bacterium]
MGRTARVIVLGNEKGGTGKSTTAMHLVVAMMRSGKRVATIDLDLRQGSLTRYVENRRMFAREFDGDLPLSTHFGIPQSTSYDRETAAVEEMGRLEEAIESVCFDHDAIVIDTPGSDTRLGRIGHSYADLLITPLNDSFVDLDVLAKVDPGTMRIAGPSHYAQMVWEQKMARAKRDGGSMDWLVMRNRLGHTDARNKRDVGRLIDELARRIGFRTAPGFGERVIFRELFHKGLTLLDMREVRAVSDMTLSHVAARQEVRALVEAVGLT